jgi:uncharacterized protein involved in exopolysaccharide biosynthesis
MNTPLKFDHEKRPTFQFERPDNRTHYEDLAARILWSILRRSGLIVLFVAVAFALACIIIPNMPRKYSAEALIYPNLFSREQEKIVALASIDATSFVTGEARLLRSDAFLRAVAKRVGEDALTHSWLQNLDWVRAKFLPETRNHSPFDRLVSMLRNKVAVMNDTRSYIISISFTASSAEEAARVVNAFVLEYVRNKEIQRRLDKLNATEGQLQQQLAVYGDKHPKTIRAVEERDAARISFEAAVNPQNGDQDEIGPDQSVKLAEPNQTPTSPNGLMILAMSLLGGLLAGIALAIWLDRRDIKRGQKDFYQAHPQ